MEDAEKSKKILLKRGAVLGALVVVIVGAWLFFRTNPSSLGIGSSTDLGLLSSERQAGKQYASAVGYYVEPFRLKGSNGKIIDFQKDILGKKTLLVFQATWCVYCKQELNDLKQIAAEKRVNFITVDINEEESLVQAHLAQYGISYPWYYDPGGAVSTWFLLAGTPTHVYIDQTGKIIRRDAGYQSAQQLNEAINQLLAS